MAQGAAAPELQTAHRVQHQEGHQAVGAHPAAFGKPAVQTGHPDRAGGNARAHAGGQQTGDFLGTGVHVFGQLHQIAILQAHFAFDPDHSRGAGLQVGHPDHVVISHCVGDVFRRLTGQDVAVVGAVTGQDEFDAVQVVSAVGYVLKLDHLAQARQGHFDDRGGQGLRASLQVGPGGGQVGGAVDRQGGLCGLRFRGFGCGGLGLGKGGGKGAQRAFDALATAADRGLERRAREREHAGACKRAEQGRGNH